MYNLKSRENRSKHAAIILHFANRKKKTLSILSQSRK